MKYTRYDIKNKKSKKNMGASLLYFGVTLIIAVILGTIGSKFLFRHGAIDNDKKQEIDTSIVEEKGNKTTTGDYKLYLVQCGVFKVKENAEEVVKKLSNLGEPITEQQGELYKVYFGIYTEEQSKNICENLKEKSIDSTRIPINIIYEDLSTGQLCKITDSVLQVINKVYESQIEYVNTEELKKWTQSLDPIDETMKHYSEVQQLKEYVNNLPDKIKKGDKQVQEGRSLVYEKLIKFKNS